MPLNPYLFTEKKFISVSKRNRRQAIETVENMALTGCTLRQIASLEAALFVTRISFEKIAIEISRSIHAAYPNRAIVHFPNVMFHVPNRITSQIFFTLPLQLKWNGGCKHLSY
ncbi:hypothetical protein Misp06_00359 [Microbulbifer sp. NBRC 101763]